MKYLFELTCCVTFQACPDRDLCLVPVVKDHILNVSHDGHDVSNLSSAGQGKDQVLLTIDFDAAFRIFVRQHMKISMLSLDYILMRR